MSGGLTVRMDPNTSSLTTEAPAEAERPSRMKPLLILEKMWKLPIRGGKHASTSPAAPGLMGCNMTGAVAGVWSVL